MLVYKLMKLLGDLPAGSEVEVFLDEFDGKKRKVRHFRLTDNIAKAVADEDCDEIEIEAYYE